MYWFEDPLIGAQLPLPLKGYSAYCRFMVDRSSGMIKGGSFLLRTLRRFRSLWGSVGRTAVRIDGVTIVLDLYTEVASFALTEMTASSHEVRVMQLAMSKGDTFLDVGANHGAFSLIASSIVGSEGAVVAFEPQPDLADLLQSSFDANHFSNATIYQIALSDHRGTATFYVPAHAGLAGIYQGFSGRGIHKELRVSLATLDEQMKKVNSPGKLFVKLDVEGSELPFLCGAQDTIRNRRPVILMEINPDSATAAGYTTADLISKLKELGYSRFAEMKEYPRSVPFDDLGEKRLGESRDIVVVP